MARILALDYGLRKTGIAVTDPLQIIATPLETVQTDVLIEYLKKYFLSEEVEHVVIGMPVNLEGEDTHSTEEVRSFIEKFKTTFFGKSITTIDERFTSKLAFDAMLKGGMKKKQRSIKENIDKLSATIILQDYLTTIQ